MKKRKTQSSTSANFCPPEPKTRSSPSKLMQPKEQLPACTSTCYPRSLSISDMFKLGKINNEIATTIVKIFKFDMELLSWSKVSTTVEFYEERGPIGTWGFRKAFKATSKHAEFINKKWSLGGSFLVRFSLTFSFNLFQASAMIQPRVLQGMMVVAALGSVENLILI